MFVSFMNSVKKKLPYRGIGGKDEEERIVFNIFIELRNDVSIKNVVNQIASLNKLNSLLYPKNVSLLPLSDNYFNADFYDWDLQHGNIELVKILSVIGIFILLLAVINFVNLSTASRRQRMTEISVKKCLGADRKVLVRQLLTESLITCTVSSSLEFRLQNYFYLISTNLWKSNYHFKFSAIHKL